MNHNVHQTEGYNKDRFKKTAILFDSFCTFNGKINPYKWVYKYTNIKSLNLYILFENWITAHASNGYVCEMLAAAAK